MAKLSLRGLTKKYPGGVIAVDNINLDVEERDFVVLVGPSGCGKSTTLRMIAGLEEISAGELLMDGRRINETAPKDRDMAMVFQNYALYPHMSVYDNMAFGLKMRKLPKREIRERIDKVAHMLEIGHLLRQRPGALSGGQRQRVAMGRAIVRRPNIFLLDEPLSNLDAALRDQIRIELIGLHSELRATFIYVTHDQVEAMTLGTRIVVMKDGVIEQSDTPVNVYKAPANIFVAGFIGLLKMNMFTTQVEATGGNICLNLAGCYLPLARSAQSIVADSIGIGREVVVGIRPEDIHLKRDSVGETPCEVTARVKLVEPRGADSIIHLGHTAGNIALKAPLEAGYRPGDNCTVYFSAESLNLFSAQTGDRI